MNFDTVVKPELLTDYYDVEFTYAPLPWDAIKPEYLETLKAINPEAKYSPVIANYEGNYIKRVLPSQVGMVKGKPTLLWGGFSNKAEWITLDNPEYGIEEMAGKATVVVYVGSVEFPVWQDSELRSISLRGIEERMAKVNTENSFSPTRKLSELEPGKYPVTASKSIETKYGVKYIISLGEQGDFWANSFVTKRLSLGINPVGKTLMVKESYTSKTGNQVADCLLVDN